MLKVFSTFSGVWGFEVGLRNALGEIEIVGFSEVDKYSIQILEKNFPWVKNYGDISKINPTTLPDFDILVGGFPCQDVSIAWKGDLSRGRTILVEYLLKILEEKRPKYFIFENVKGILSEKFRDFYTSILDEIVRLGYDVDASVYNTKDYGIPHNRERVFFTGARDGELIFFRKPQPIKLEKHLGDLLEDKVDKKYFLTEKFLEWATGREGAFEGRFKIKSPESVANCLTTRGGGRITDNFIFQYPRGKNKWGVKEICPTITANQWEHNNVLLTDGSLLIPANTNVWYEILSPGDGINLAYPKSKTRRGRVQKGVSSTLVCNDQQGVYTKDLKVRRLLPIECERLQGYPDNWTLDVSDTQRYRQMGNSISTVIPEFIARNLILKESI